MESISEVSRLVRPDMTIALGDGLGAPRAVSAELSAAAARCGGVRLILGWVPRADPGLDFAAFADVRTFMPGWGLRPSVDAGLVQLRPGQAVGRARAPARPMAAGSADRVRGCGRRRV